MINYLSPDFSAKPDVSAPHSYYSLNLAGGELSAPVDVSIVTPFYNTEALFEETARSVRLQTLQNWEWIIVDDGSTDSEAVQRLRVVAESDSRIQVFRQENAGPGAARNRAFAESRGRYICILDSDDLLEPSYLEKCVWFLESNSEFAFCNSYSVVFGEEEYLWTNGFERNKDHLRANSGPPISVVRRHAFEECGGFDASIRFGHEDWDFWLAMAKAGFWGATLREFLQWYRKRGSGRFEQIMKSGDVNDRFERLMAEKYKGLEDRFPRPQAKPMLPYESVPTEIPVKNRVDVGAKGRKILFILPWMVVGGADRVNLDLIEGLVGRGHHVSVCATLDADHRWEYRFAELTPDVFVLPNFLRPIDYPRFLTYLIDSRQVDTVVVTGSTFGYQLLPYLQSRAPHVAFLDLCHVEEPHWLNGGHPRFGVGYQDALDLNVVSTDHLRRWMEERGAAPEKIEVMCTGVRPAANRTVERRLEIRDSYGLVESDFVVAFAGRLCPQKRPELLCEIFVELKRRGVKFRGIVVGDGELRESVEARVAESGLADHVMLVRSLPHERWLDLLVATDVLLMPSQYEGISIALLEAMMSGVVPIVAKVGGQEEVVTANEGFLVEHRADELEEYCAAVEMLCSDRSLLDDMKSASERLANSRFSWSQGVVRFEALAERAHENRLRRKIVVTHALGLELASLALEYMRLSDAVNWLWGKAHGSGASVLPAVPAAASGGDLARLVMLLMQTRVVVWARSNSLARSFGRWLLKSLNNREKRRV